MMGGYNISTMEATLNHVTKSSKLKNHEKKRNRNPYHFYLNMVHKKSFQIFSKAFVHIFDE